MKKLLATIILGSVIATTPALAQDRGNWAPHDQNRQDALQRADRMFDMLDTNHDGVLTKAEAQQALAQFAAARGGEGGGGRMGRMVDMMFGASASVTRQQTEAQALARFDAMDLNHDGVASVAEQQQARAQRQAMRSGQ